MSDLWLQVEILWPALCAGLLVVGTHVPLGREVLQRGIIFLDLAIAQTAAFGVVLANTFWIGDHTSHAQGLTTLVAVVAAISGSALLYSIRNMEVRLQESMIGILFVLMATGIILVLSADPHGGERLKEILVGQILWLQPRDLLHLFGAYIVLFAGWYLGRKWLGDWVFYPVFAITITLATQFVGVYLVFASLIVPSVVTLYHKRPVLKGYCLGAAGYVVGLVLSALFDFPAGASIVWSLALVGAVYALGIRSKRSGLQG